MLRTGPQPDAWFLGPFLAAGLTLTDYKSFQICPSLPALKQRIEQELRHYLKSGIQVMASSTADNCITIGDSHEYGLAVEPFNKDFIDQLILTYLDGFAHFTSPGGAGMTLSFGLADENLRLNQLLLARPA